MARFPNLAGDTDCDLHIVKELERAGIEGIKMPWARKAEVASHYIGHLNGWEFTRAWYYWTAKAEGNLLLFKHADPLHGEHGEEVRVDGHCGCPSPREWCKAPWRIGVSLYHVDSQEALNALAEAIKRQGEEDGKGDTKYIHCHRQACQEKIIEEDAWWNISIREWYCIKCAQILNIENPPNDHFPHILCIPYSQAVQDEDS